MTGSAMCRIRFAIFAILLGIVAAADSAGAGEAEVWTALRAGGHVALMRHTDAPGGVGDPPGFRIDDCSTQRNLSAKGRADAARIGARLKSEGIAVERIVSSPWCRCMDTATLLQSHDRPLSDDILSGGRQGWPAILSSLKSVLETGNAPAIQMAPPQRMLDALKEMGIKTP